MDSYFKPVYVRKHFRKKPDSNEQVPVKGHYRTYRVEYIMDGNKRSVGGLSFDDALKVVKQVQDTAENLEMEAEE